MTEEQTCCHPLSRRTPEQFKRVPPLNRFVCNECGALVVLPFVLTLDGQSAEAVMELLKCPCHGETELHEEDDDDPNIGTVYQVRCAKCGANGDCYIGTFGYQSAIKDWNREVEKGYVPHAGGDRRGVIEVK